MNSGEGILSGMFVNSKERVLNILNDIEGKLGIFF